MELKQARTEALILANARKVSHVIVKVGNGYNVYLKSQYPQGFDEEVNPKIKIESIIEEPKEVKPRVKKTV
jgi:hypothetical protein